MSAETQDKLLDNHSYDGIQEFDNPLPGWWKWLFGITVIFFVPYWVYFHFGTPGRSIPDQYEAEMSYWFTKKFSEIGELKPDRETLLAYMKDDRWLAVGKAAWKTNCVSCHGLEGEGQVGPNMTDDVFKNVRTIEDIATVISKGAANGAMPAWEKRFSHPNMIVLTAAYVASMRGKNLPGKLAEGNQIPPWE